MAGFANLSLDVDYSALENAIYNEISKELNKFFDSILVPVKLQVGTLITNAIRLSPEYSSLLNGKLRSEFGVIKAEPTLEGIIRSITDGIVVTNLGVKNTSKKLEGGIRIEILKSDYSEVLNVDNAFYFSKGHKIDWVRWLTLEGDRIIIGDYRIVYDSSFVQSRTKSALMFPVGTWKVPAEYSGTYKDNWITRSIEKVVPNIEKIIESELK